MEETVITRKPVDVKIEYCTKCNFRTECFKLKEFLESAYPSANVECDAGRRGSFEVVINGTLVHSKLSTLAFPNDEDVLDNVIQAGLGNKLRKCTEKTITDCVIQ